MIDKRDTNELLQMLNRELEVVREARSEGTIPAIYYRKQLQRWITFIEKAEEDYERYRALSVKPRFRKLDDWEESCLMTLVSFRNADFTEDDGKGYYVKGTAKGYRVSSIDVFDDSRPTWATHVVWYNK